MNYNKIIKDLKERNNKLRNQYELLEIQTCTLEIKNKRLTERLDRIKKYLYTIHKEAKYGILSSENLIYENINRLCEGKDLIKSSEEDKNEKE